MFLYMQFDGNGKSSSCLQRTCLISSSVSGTTIRTAQWRAAPISVPTVRGRDTEALVGAPMDSVPVNRPPWNLIRNAI